MNKIAEAELGGEEVDLSGYVSKEELEDKGYLTGIPEEYVTDEELNSKGYLTEHQDLSGYVSKEELEDKGYLTGIPEEYVTDEELNSKGYLTEHQDISDKANKTDIPTKVSQLENDKGYLTNIPSEYITETELKGKGYLTNIPSEYITETELEESLANKFDNVEVNEAETNDTKTALDFYANGEIVKTVYFTGGGNVNTPPYVTLLSAENNILGLGEVFNLELDFLSGVTGKGTLKVFVNDIEVVSKSIPQGENTIPITDDIFIKGSNRMTLYVIDRAGTMSNSVTLYVRYGSLL